MTTTTKAAPAPVPEPRKGQPDVRLTREAFDARMRERFYDPAFDAIPDVVNQVLDKWWDAYEGHRKAPRTKKAGLAFADPTYDLSEEWLAAHRAITEAQARHDDASSKSRILLVCASPRNEHTCPGEMSKSYRMTELVREQVLQESGFEVEVLDLSRTTAELGRQIHPCKSCVSTAMPLCHWPCSCYPNHSLGQVHDWMNEIYPMWVAAHGIVLIAPVHWYQAPDALKLLIDRLVCADGGNADPTTTHGKSAKKAKEIELAGWDYPKHLAGRAYSVVVHGDAGGVEQSKDALAKWLRDLGLEDAGNMSLVARYIGYFEPYANNHEELDRDAAMQEEMRVAARAIVEKVKQLRAGKCQPADHDLTPARQK